jgi:hypothetical protein
MHAPVKANLEDYLAGCGSLPREFTAHLLSCEECRQELAEVKAHSTLVRVLQCPEEIEPLVGFYARVIERIEAQRQSSFWGIFLEPAFGRRLAVASAAFAVLMGLYLVGSEPGSASIAVGRFPAPVEMLAGEDQPGPVLSFEQNQDQDQDQDRGTILVNLATFRQE